MGYAATTMAEAVQRGRREEAEAEARRRAAEAREDQNLRDLLACDPRAGWAAWIDALVRRHRVTVHWIGRHEPARAASRRRVIWTWPVVDDESFLTAMHELAHVANPCPGTPPHQREGEAGCVSCEVAATSMVAKWVPLTRTQHAYLGACLRTYRQTPAPAEAVQRLDALAGSRAWAEDRQKRLHWARLQERQRLAMTGGTHR